MKNEKERINGREKEKYSQHQRAKLALLSKWHSSLLRTHTYTGEIFYYLCTCVHSHKNPCLLSHRSIGSSDSLIYICVYMREIKDEHSILQFWKFFSQKKEKFLLDNNLGYWDFKLSSYIYFDFCNTLLKEISIFILFITLRINFLALFFFN